MPLYEYYCDSCNGIYEAMRPMREASLSVPCPECDRDGRRIMSAFNAFSFREGYPRRLPDKGTYLHYGKEVKKRANKMEGTVHPELAQPKAQPRLSRGDAAAHQEAWVDRQEEMKHRAKEGVGLYMNKLPKARKPKKEVVNISPTGKSAEEK